MIDHRPIAVGSCAKCGNRIEYHQLPYSNRRRWFHADWQNNCPTDKKWSVWIEEPSDDATHGEAFA